MIYRGGESPFHCTEAQAELLEQLSHLKHGGIGNWVHGYRPTTGYVIAPVLDIQILTSFSLSKVYERRKRALDSITFAEVAEAVALHPQLSHLKSATILEHFRERKRMLVKTIVTTLTGNREDNRRMGADRCYIHVFKCVKVNIKSKRYGNIQEPILLDGLPIMETVLVTYLELSRKVIQEGKKKPPPRSGIPVLIGNIIESKLNARSHDLKTLTLRADNFISLEVNKAVVTPPHEEK